MRESTMIDGGRDVPMPSLEVQLRDLVERTERELRELNEDRNDREDYLRSLSARISRTEKTLMNLRVAVNELDPDMQKVEVSHNGYK